MCDLLSELTRNCRGHPAGYSKPVTARGSVPVLVVQVGNVRMGVVQRHVAVPVAVRTGGHGVVRVVVVAIVVAVGVLVGQRFVRVQVVVRLGQVQQHHLQNLDAAIAAYRDVLNAARA